MAKPSPLLTRTPTPLPTPTDGSSSPSSTYTSASSSDSGYPCPSCLSSDAKIFIGVSIAIFAVFSIVFSLYLFNRDRGRNPPPDPNSYSASNPPSGRSSMARNGAAMNQKRTKSLSAERVGERDKEKDSMRSKSVSDSSLSNGSSSAGWEMDLEKLLGSGAGEGKYRREMYVMTSAEKNRGKHDDGGEGERWRDIAKGVELTGEAKDIADLTAEWRMEYEDGRRSSSTGNSRS